jgi:hypothetical protein
LGIVFSLYGKTNSARYDFFRLLYLGYNFL